MIQIVSAKAARLHYLFLFLRFFDAREVFHKFFGKTMCGSSNSPLSFDLLSNSLIAEITLTIKSIVPTERIDPAIIPMPISNPGMNFDKM